MIRRTFLGLIQLTTILVLYISANAIAVNETEPSTGTESVLLSQESHTSSDLLENENVPLPRQPDTAQKPVPSDVPPAQVGPFIDIFGPTLLSLEIVNQSRAEIRSHRTNEVLLGKKVIGLYFSADWCGPCRKFTPDLVTFYKKINQRRGRKDEFEIVWISRCRDVNAFGQYFTHMGGWYALPPEEAMGNRGAKLGEKYKVKGIPFLVLLDDLGNVITTDARNKIPQDKAGIGFPWRNPIATLYVNIVPKSLRLLLKSQIVMTKDRIISTFKRSLGLT